jgi:hypothetical protein
MDPLSLSCLWNGPIKLMLFTVWTNQCYVLLGKGPIKFKLFTSWIHLNYAVYNMDPLNLYCLQYGHIRRMFITIWTVQTYIV